jgi:hypothetical protein
VTRPKYGGGRASARRLMLVLVRPYNADFLRDELFRPISVAGGQWLNFMAEAARILLAEGIELHTWDMRADMSWVNLPGLPRAGRS